MPGAKILISLIFCFLFSAIFSQDYFSYGSSNYGGVTQLISNPAASAGNKLKLDVLLGGFDVTFNNSWGAVKKEALAFPTLPPSWKNYTPNFEGNVYKNFEWQSGNASKEVHFEQRLLLPSVMLRLDSKNSIALVCNMRQIGNISGISPALAYLFENEFGLHVLRNNQVQNKDFMAIRMSWIEYGINYARVIVGEGPHHLKAGITPKLLQGLESSYFWLRDLNFWFTNKDTTSYLEADFSVAHSPRSGSVLDITDNPSEKLRQSTLLAFGLDLGLIYEWHPSGSVSGKDAPLKKSGGQTMTNYKLKVGVSLVDLGKMRFKKEPNYYEMQLDLRNNDIVRYLASDNVRMIDSLLQTDFPANTGSDEFSVTMPTAVNTQVDYAFNSHLYLNLSAHFSGFYSSNLFKVRNYSAVCISPRFESYWADVSLLLTWNALSAKRSQSFTPGISFRIGPLSIGSYDLGYLYKNSLSSLNFFTMLRVSIPHKIKKVKKAENKIQG